VKSLRLRLVLGSVLWTVGLLVATNFVIFGMVLHRFSGPLVHLGAMSVAGAGFLIAGLLQLRSVLAPFRRLREELGAVRAGSSPRIEGSFPSEVAPVVSDLNALLEHRTRLVQRAQSKAGDLAHGLKTPLAVLGHEAERLRHSGQTEAADMVGQQVERMRRQIDYHLAHARAVASGSRIGVSTSVLDAAEGLARTLRRLHAEKGMSISLAIAPEARVGVGREDLEEMMGNLLDNACKWAKSGVWLTAEAAGPSLAILIDDDGPGIAPSLRSKVLERGARADESAPGSGFGLAIVGDLAELHGGTLALEDSPRGGVRVRLVLPSHEAETEQ